MAQFISCDLDIQCLNCERDSNFGRWLEGELRFNYWTTTFKDGKQTEKRYVEELFKKILDRHKHATV